MKNIFQEIKDRPMRLCKKCNKCLGAFPTSFWAKLPEGCGFNGWFFQKREEIKQRIRKQKEILLDCETLLRENPDLTSNELLETINNIKKEIDIYKEFGSENW